MVFRGPDVLLLLLVLVGGTGFADELPVFDDPGVSLIGAPGHHPLVQVVTKDEIETAQASDLAALLEATLDLGLNRNGAYGNQVGVGIRGMGSGRVAFLINGVPVNSAQTGTFDLSQVALGSVQEIEVVRGGSDTLSSITGAVGGVVNLITVPQTSGSRVGGQVSSLSYLPRARGASVFDTNGGDLWASWGGGGLAWSLDASAHRATNRYGFFTEEGEARWWENNEVVDAGGGASLTWNSPGGLELTGSFRGYSGTKSIPGPVGSATPGTQTDLTALTSLQARLDVGGLDHDLLVHHHHSAMTWTDPSTSARHDLDTVGLRHQVTWSIGAVSVVAGADGQVSWLDSRSLGRIRQISGGVFVTPQFTWGPEFDLVPSVKVVWGQGWDPFLVPKLGLVYRWSPDLVLKNNYFRTFKVPTLNDRFWPTEAMAAGNPHLKPEDGVGTDATLEGTWGDTMFSVTAHGTYQSQAILWQPQGGQWRPENIGKALIYGADTTLKQSWGRAFTLDSRYSLLLTNLLTDGLTWADQRRMPYRPMHTLGLGGQWRWATGSLGLRGHFESLRYTSTLNLYSLPGFTTVDVTLEQNLGLGITLVSSLTNALNQGYSTLEGYPLPGAALTVGVKVSL